MQWTIPKERHTPLGKHTATGRAPEQAARGCTQRSVLQGEEHSRDVEMAQSVIWKWKVAFQGSDFKGYRSTGKTNKSYSYSHSLFPFYTPPSSSYSFPVLITLSLGDFIFSKNEWRVKFVTTNMPSFAGLPYTCIPPRVCIRRHQDGARGPIPTLLQPQALLMGSEKCHGWQSWEKQHRIPN